MRAAAATQCGPPSVVRVVEVPAPEPRAGEVVVRVHSVAVTAADARIRAARFPRGFAPFARLVFGLRRPRRTILGSAISGVVETVGDGADLAVGDAVTGLTGMRFGGHAELVAVAAAKLVPKPSGVTHDDAAGILFGGTTALHYLRDLGRLGGLGGTGRLGGTGDDAAAKPGAAIRGTGASVLVIGASGAIGTAAVQLARRAGARVTAVTSAPNAELVRSLGAEEIVDHTLTPVAGNPDLAGRFDIVLDAVGTLSRATGLPLLAPGGVLLLAVADLAQTIGARGPVKAGSAPERPADVARLLELLDAGALVSVTDAVHPLSAIAAAHERVDSGRKVGNVIVRPGE